MGMKTRIISNANKNEKTIWLERFIIMIEKKNIEEGNVSYC